MAARCPDFTEVGTVQYEEQPALAPERRPLTSSRRRRYTSMHRDDVHHVQNGLSKADEANPQAAGVCEFVT